MVQRLFQPIGYQNVDLGDRARKLEPFIDGFYSREGKRSRQQLQDFIKQLPGPLGGRGLDTNVAAKMAAHYNQREAIRAASLKDPFLTVREAQILPLSITKQSETFSYRVGVSYTDINNQPATKFITLRVTFAV